MAGYDPTKPGGDPFGPPPVPTLVRCLHCGEEYDSYRIEWRVERTASGQPHGFWCCPTEGCGGAGFGCDILPVDPNYRDERGGWVYFDDEDEDDEPLPEDEDEGNGGTARESGDDDPIPW